MKISLLVTGLGVAMAASNAQAALTAHTFVANAGNYCQAFTPGPANTFRVRAVGVENVGTVNANLACNWHTMAGEAGFTDPTALDVYFFNNTSANITVTCTLFNGYQGQGGAAQYLNTKSAVVTPGAQNDILWTQADNPTAGATTLGNALININCTMPPGAIANDTYLQWTQGNGVTGAEAP